MTGLSRMSPEQEFEDKERERKVRRWGFYLILVILALNFGLFLIWKFSYLVLPIITGALLAWLR
jgi:hypothetical protein